VFAEFHDLSFGIVFFPQVAGLVDAIQGYWVCKVNIEVSHKILEGQSSTLKKFFPRGTSCYQNGVSCPVRQVRQPGLLVFVRFPELLSSVYPRLEHGWEVVKVDGRGKEHSPGSEHGGEKVPCLIIVAEHASISFFVAQCIVAEAAGHAGQDYAIAEVFDLTIAPGFADTLEQEFCCSVRVAVFTVAACVYDCAHRLPALVAEYRLFAVHDRQHMVILVLEFEIPIREDVFLMPYLILS
jgi:hypothetical protein